MGLWQFLRSLFGFRPRPPTHSRNGAITVVRRRRVWKRAKLDPLRRTVERPRRSPAPEADGSPPYRFARFGSRTGRYLDLSRDVDPQRLAEFNLPRFDTPEELADWLHQPLNKVAWLVHRFTENRPESVQRSHYHYQWQRKRSGGWRLIEAPKATLKAVQQQILAEILNHIPAHDAAHGFVAGRSILTNAEPHVGQRVIVKLDLENFYPSVRFARVVAIFRGVGYCREAAIWLARLTTSCLPSNMPLPGGQATALLPFLPRHLPQGAPTSPALANLSAYSLDVRLSGMARAFGATYTRYADDLTFSGSEELIRKLPVFVPFIQKIVADERFRVHREKRRVIRSNQRQTVTGVVVNERPNISRAEYDRLKAILTNCRRHGPASQNHEGRLDFAAHLQGCIAHVRQLNPERGEKLLRLFRQIDWRR